MKNKQRKEEWRMTDHEHIVEMEKKIVALEVEVQRLLEMHSPDSTLRAYLKFFRYQAKQYSASQDVLKELDDKILELSK